MSIKSENQSVTHVQKNLFNSEHSYQRISYAYKGNRIEFRFIGNLMVNATEMAKPFGVHKKPVHWLRYSPSQEFIAALIKVRKNTLADNQINNTYKSYYGGLVVTQKGGVNPGTWMHEDVALEFARWLSPEFAIWCNDRIKEILLGKAQNGINEKQISDLVATHINEPNNLFKQYSKELSKKFNLPLLTPDMINFKWNEKDSLYKNIENLLISYRYNSACALYSFYSAYKRDKENQEIRKFLHDFIHKACSDYELFPC